jgi:hypothetical protein
MLWACSPSIARPNEVASCRRGPSSHRDPGPRVGYSVAMPTPQPQDDSLAYADRLFLAGLGRRPLGHYIAGQRALE